MDELIHPTLAKMVTMTVVLILGFLLIYAVIKILGGL